MPSDCQCSSPHEIIREVVLSDKEATRRLDRLEKEVEALRNENAILSRDLKGALKTREEMIEELRRKLNNL
jgi:hypothetical protein